METTITFFLGLLSGTVPLGIAYAIWNALRVNKSISTIKNEIQRIKETDWNRQQDTDGRFAFRDQVAKEERQELDRMLDTFYRRIEELNTRIDNSAKEAGSYTEEFADSLHDRITDIRDLIDGESREIRSYIDKRIDKTVDVLCDRMDSLNNKSPYKGGGNTPYANGGYAAVTTSAGTPEAPDRIYS
jgi:hypothetical protein